MKKKIITMLLIVILAILLGSCLTVHVHVPKEISITPTDSLQIESYWY